MLLLIKMKKCGLIILLKFNKIKPSYQSYLIFKIVVLLMQTKVFLWNGLRSEVMFFCFLIKKKDSITCTSANTSCSYQMFMNRWLIKVWPFPFYFIHLEDAAERAFYSITPGKQTNFIPLITPCISR